MPFKHHAVPQSITQYHETPHSVMFNDVKRSATIQCFSCSASLLGWLKGMGKILLKLLRRAQKASKAILAAGLRNWTAPLHLQLLLVGTAVVLTGFTADCQAYMGLYGQLGPVLEPPYWSHS